MNKDWMIFEHSTYLIFGVFFSLFAGLLVGGAVGLATEAYYLSFWLGVLIALWVGMIYFGEDE